ncbi:hypothetical protein E3U23_10920 [Erythrobacter litoralis]|uniref:hypothetical protein n=1 Tax=Erythrobacter litoralis TaxID=39960 RepID=UPI002434899E|nr:hypothetical protein [Erythrobacter litoralis]MDG6079700.1 hypothetical protein [Erythrobacter litoralis]
MTKRRLSSSLRLLPFIAIVAATPALAGGVPAGSIIENTASATYDDSGVERTVSSNTVEVMVEELLDVTVTSQDGSAVSIGSGSAVLTYELTNTGNGPEAFILTADPARTGNDFDPTVTGIAYDTNGNGIYDEGVDLLLGADNRTPVLNADDTLTVFILVDTPAGVNDGQTASVNLLVQAATGTGQPGTAFPGQGEGGSDAIVGATSADDDADGQLTAAVAAVTLSKSAVVSDPFGGNEVVPGATVTFTIVANVTGTGSFDAFTINDRIPDFTTYSPGTLTFGGASLTDGADGDAGSVGSNGVSVNLGTVTSGNSYAVSFDVVVN